MITRAAREIGEPFSMNEQTLLNLLCTGEGPHLARAREQLLQARWGGYEFPNCDCFLIMVGAQPQSSCISHAGGPFSVAEVCCNGELLGHLNLWVVDGKLHSVDYMTFEDDHYHLPGPDEFNIERID